MSAPERFQVGDTVRCVDATRWPFYITEGQEYEVVSVDEPWVRIVTSDGKVNGYRSHRFVLVSRPTPPALDPFAWTDLAGHLMGNPGIEFDLRIKSAPFITAWVAWSRFCYWAAQSNLAAHFLPTTPAARTRASNGRDVPVATVLVELPVDDAATFANCYSDSGRSGRIGAKYRRLGEACRRALGAS